MDDLSSTKTKEFEIYDIFDDQALTILDKKFILLEQIR